MKWLIAWMLSVCILPCAIAGEPAPEPGLSAEQIVEKNIAARGGPDAWRKIQSMVWVGHIESANAPAPNLPFVLVQQHPNKTRFEIKTQNQISLHVYDGTRGWKMRPTSSGKPELQPYSREELSFAADGQSLAEPLTDYQARGITVALDGIDEVEGHKAYRLNVTLPSGASHHVWIDAKTFLDLKSDREYRNSRGQSGRLAMFYRNYKTIEGVQIPLMIESGTDITRASDKMVIDRVTLNPQLDDKTFARPNVPSGGKLVSAIETPQSDRSAELSRPRSVSGSREAR
jgi:outer membrane lipoprotein-sorting protein